MRKSGVSDKDATRIIARMSQEYYVEKGPVEFKLNPTQFLSIPAKTEHTTLSNDTTQSILNVRHERNIISLANFNTETGSTR